MAYYSYVYVAITGCRLSVSHSVIKAQAEASSSAVCSAAYEEMIQVVTSAIQMRCIQEDSPYCLFCLLGTSP